MRTRADGYLMPCGIRHAARKTRARVLNYIHVEFLAGICRAVLTDDKMLIIMIMITDLELLIRPIFSAGNKRAGEKQRGGNHEIRKIQPTAGGYKRICHAVSFASHGGDYLRSDPADLPEDQPRYRVP